MTRTVFNFFLLDPGIILPNTKAIVPQSVSEDESEVLEGMEGARDGSMLQQQEENEHETVKRTTKKCSNW